MREDRGCVLSDPPSVRSRHAHAIVALVMRELRRHLEQPATRARLVLDGARQGAMPEEVFAVMERVVMLIDKRADDPPPSTLRVVR